MNTIKNIALLIDKDQGDIEKMEHAANEHKRHGNIVFKISEYEQKKAVIQVSQERNATGIYHTQKRLIEIVHESFDRFFPGRKIHVHAIVYNKPAVDKVDPAWINKQMMDTGTRLKDISDDSGLGYANLSTLVNGNAPLSQPMKAFFYYYFLAKAA